MQTLSAPGRHCRSLPRPLPPLLPFVRCQSSAAAAAQSDFDFHRFAFAAPAFEDLATGNLSGSLSKVNNDFPVYEAGGESEGLWRRYAAELRRRGVTNIDDYERMAEVFARKRFHQATFWDKVTESSRPLFEAERTHLDQLLNIGDSYAKISCRSDSLIQLLIRRGRQDFHGLPTDTVTRLVTILASLGRKHIQLMNDVAELVIEEAVAFSARSLIDLLHSYAALESRDEEMLRHAARRLHPLLCVGKLTPFEKTKLARTYALLKFNHSTFFRTVAEEILGEYERLQAKIGLGQVEQQDLAVTAAPTDALFSRYALPSYEYGCGLPSLYGLPLGSRIRKKAGKGGEEGLEGWQVEMNEGREKEVNAGLAEERRDLPEAVEGRVVEYDLGQIAIVMDAILLLRFHEWADYYRELRTVLAKRLHEPQAVEQLDPLQLAAAMNFLSTNRLVAENEDLVKAMTRRMFRLFHADLAKPFHLVFYLKGLVSWRQTPARAKNARGRTLRFFVSRKLPWLEAKEEGERFNVLERLGEHICQRVHYFTLGELSSVLRSLAYLDFGDADFYRVFVPFIKERVGDLACVDVSNVMQAFNRQRLEDRHLFYLLGKQWQAKQADFVSVKWRGKVIQGQ
ncbi:unnamed protein product [Vitrella brassicaformis CCMP3155]|uniref:Uncharacterized protein n=2 Tax=Vitrella brassicaformis TaxID=1169539 RepID=A0A0G4FIZ8_VITBC|nr:unnamed protein product [Vitrella brassicaformis CCMP3155]|eukprot:CEM13688.1 unnamed protein product [Vitrella brassicaformis CCMP3155]